MKSTTFAAAVAASVVVSIPFAAAGLRASAGEPLVKDQSTATASTPSLAELRVMTARFAPAEIGADITSLPEGERRALARLVEAAKLMDSLFLRQVWAGNDAMLQDLARAAVTRGSATGDARQAEAEARLHYFLINKGPWSRLDHNQVFIPGAPPKPESGNFYPEGADKTSVQRWIDGLGPQAKAAATGFFSTIRRPAADAKAGAAGDARPDGFTAVPYSIEYQSELAHASALLREAAELTAQPTLKRFLTTRADAFLTNDYYESDVAWMELDASIEPTIGPVRGIRGRVVQLQGGLRSFHHGARRGRVEAAAGVLGPPPGARECAADRSEIPQSAARLTGPHPRRQRGLRRR